MKIEGILSAQSLQIGAQVVEFQGALAEDVAGVNFGFRVEGQLRRGLVAVVREEEFSGTAKPLGLLCQLVPTDESVIARDRDRIGE